MLDLYKGAPRREMLVLDAFTDREDGGAGKTQRTHHLPHLLAALAADQLGDRVLDRRIVALPVAHAEKARIFRERSVSQRGRELGPGLVGHVRHVEIIVAVVA